MLGADHHGYIGRMRAMAACFGDDPDRNLEILIGQLVNLVRDGQPVRMSKRAGTIVTLEDLVDAIGVDAARYALARYSVDSPIDLDLDLWTRASNDNPVYYVQYAHARICSLLRNAADAGHRAGRRLRSRRCSATSARATCSRRSASSRPSSPPRPNSGNHTGSPATSRIWPGSTTSSTTPAGCCRSATSRPTDLNQARLWLVEASRIVLANGLGLLGVSAPERM